LSFIQGEFSYDEFLELFKLLYQVFFITLLRAFLFSSSYADFKRQHIHCVELIDPFNEDF